MTITRGIGSVFAKGLWRYALLNLGVCLVLAVSLPVVAGGIATEMQGAYDALTSEPAPRLPNLIEKRQDSAIKRGAPSPEVLARLPAVALPTVPLSSDMKLAVVELVSESAEQAPPLAAALDKAESLPVKPLRQLHRSKFRALYAALSARQKDRPTRVAQGGKKRAERLAEMAERARKRDLALLASSEDLSAGHIFQSNFSNSFAALSR